MADYVMNTDGKYGSYIVQTLQRPVLHFSISMNPTYGLKRTEEEKRTAACPDACQKQRGDVGRHHGFLEQKDGL